MLTFIAILASFVVLYFIYKPKNRQRHKPIPRKSQTQNAPARIAPGNGPPHHWQDAQDFDFEVVGESFYQQHLKGLVGEHGNDYVRLSQLAMLVPEDDNQHDNKAVRVYIDGGKVGHLSRDDARSFRRRLGAKKLTGAITTCDAEIRGGNVRAGVRSPYGVFLAIKPFGF